jgi:hypothetical protein
MASLRVVESFDGIKGIPLNCRPSGLALPSYAVFFVGFLMAAVVVNM